MENKIKIERLSAAAEKATATINRVANWEANRNNAAARLMAINAASVILSDSEDEEEKENAYNYLHTQFMASFNAQAKARIAFEASFSAIKAAAKPAVLANAVNSRGFQFDAAIRGCYQLIKAAEKAEKVLKYAETTAVAAEKAERKSKNATKRAARAAEKAAALGLSK